MEFLRDVLNNFFANAILWLLLGFIFFVLITITQYKFLGFFGLRKKRRLIVYLSNLWQPSLNNSQGCILSGHEFKVTRTVDKLFGDIPFRLPEIVRGLVESFWIGKKLQVEVRVSPIMPAEIEFTNLIVVGGTPKNSVRRYYLKEGLHHLMIDGEKLEPLEDIFDKVLASRLLICKGRHKGQKIPDDDNVDDYNVAIVEKILDDEHGTTVFFCLGFRGDCSWAAVEFLAQNWRKLNKKYREKAFALGLGFPKIERDMERYVPPVILVAFPDPKNLL